jgi:hypothetical protein
VSPSESIVFQGRLPYRRLPNVGLLPGLGVILRSGSNETAEMFAVLDSGSTFSVFQPQMAELLGIDNVTSSSTTRDISTCGGPITIYLFDVEMELLLGSSSEKFTCQVGFPDKPIPRNILGRDLAFMKFTFAFRERDESVLYSMAN